MKPKIKTAQEVFANGMGFGYYRPLKHNEFWDRYLNSKGYKG